MDALEKSIKKWEDIVAGTGCDLGQQNCALCQDFYYQDEICSGCPVAENTGLQYCEGTPYEDFHDHIAECSICQAEIGEKWFPGYGPGCGEGRRQAQRMVNFLKGLRNEKG